MAVPNSGPLSLTDLQTEFGGTSPLSLSMYYKGGAYVLATDYAPNVPTSGQISISDFYGARKTTLTTLTVTNAGDNIIVLPSTFVGNITINSMTGGGGGGGGPDSQPGISGYPGLTVTGGNIAANAGDLINLYVGPGGGAGGSGGGGGGGGGKIICTKLHQLGYLPAHIYEADEKFGQYLRTHDPYAYYGYVKWASVVVDWMERDGPQCMFWIRDKKKRGQTQQALAIKWARKIATPWAEHMAYTQGVGEQDNRAGRLIMKTGMWISRLIGKYTKTTEPSTNVMLGYMMWLTFGLFWLIAATERDSI